ncbi:MAG TPA: putative toxin-antitoxin system toxin component, PIN family [Nitrospirae bacterium]|nr:PIN domain protein [bacterium BMS3Abin06]HDH11310.1 putative toxin-antitoxin system toxin component, PIN family [Nitrospirota bacterium]HDL20373.1 putative toxin-antitoxin system toxin component, PIN family [Nitrospirota bacterium]HDZ00511.1 putative toxin-antitoxin system toxin component, PIN family [Nitrospirota bacterium]
MSEINIILDTNVLHAGLYSSRGASYQILKLIEKGKIKIFLSTALLFEYEDVLKRNKRILKLTDSDIEKILDNLCKLSDHQKIYFLWRPYLPDPNDDLILELAVASETKTIVTHNIKDFKGINKFGVRAIAPKILLEEIK